MRRWGALFFAVALVGGVYPDAGGDLAARIMTVTGVPEYRHARWGILVTEPATGRVLYERNADEFFVPASTTKLYSCSAALNALGADYRFETPVYARGKVEAKQLHGDLILVANGDLTFGGRTLPDGTLAFTNTDHTYADSTSTTESLTPTDPLTGLRSLARRVKDAGVTAVEGDVLVDSRLFEVAASSGSGPRVVTPIVVNDNVIDVVVSPAAAAGQPAGVSLRPACSFIDLDAQVNTCADGLAEITVSGVGFQKVIVRGRVPVGAKPQLRTLAVDDPAAFARMLFIDLLRHEGVTVRASALREPQADLPARDAYGSLTKVAEFRSAPFSEVVKVTLKVSQNLYASTMPLLVAAKHGERTLTAGLGRQRDFLRGLGVDSDAVSFGGGAGGERSDATTPRATVTLLTALTKRPDWTVFEKGLPVLGVDGTLATAAPADSPAAGHVRAKTGTLWYSDVMNGRGLLTSKALAGLMTTARGKTLVFAAFVNNVPLPIGVTPSREGRTLGRLCEVLYESPG
jgi:D-alanyl-D-alanine carboxypeptidase/D-alanyl-D-alanine-endopeptidase (penicillin-binding protein 4)